MGLHFVIDEGHLSKEYFNTGLRNCYGEIPGVNKDHFNEYTIIIAPIYNFISVNEVLPRLRML